MNAPVLAARVPTRPEHADAIRAAAEILTECARVATLAVSTQDELQKMEAAGVGAAATAAALTAVMRTGQSQAIGSYPGLAFTLGMAFGEILRTVQQVDLGVLMERLGEGIGCALEAGRPAPVGGLN